MNNDEFGEEIVITRAKMGRPPKLVVDEPTLKRIRELGAIQCTQAEAAAVMLCSQTTFRSFLADNKQAHEAFELGKETGKASLRRTQFMLAKKSAAMAIWLGKQYLGQKDRDRIEVGGIADGVPVSLEHGMAQGLTALLARARLEQARKKLQ